MYLSHGLFVCLLGLCLRRGLLSGTVGEKWPIQNFIWVFWGFSVGFFFPGFFPKQRIFAQQPKKTIPFHAGS